MFSTLLIIHIGGGAVGLAFGMAALFAPKGKGVHTKAGTIFFNAMLVMAGTAGVLAEAKSITASLLIAALTCYLLATSRAAVTSRPGTVTLFDKGAFLVAFCLGLVCFSYGMMAANSETGSVGGFPAPVYFIFGGIALIAAIGDMRMLLKGGLRGKARVVRHLWRMCFVLFVAAASIFLGNSQVFQGFVSTKFLAMPVLLIVLVSTFWFFRAKYGNWYQKA